MAIRSRMGYCTLPKGTIYIMAWDYRLLFGTGIFHNPCEITFNSSHAFPFTNRLLPGNSGQNISITMRKILFLLVLNLMSATAFAQKEVTIKAGTIIPLKATNTVAAADVAIGDKIGFSVSRDINVEGLTAIPYGTLASGKVTLAKKSSWWGTRGRLSVEITELVMPNGNVIPLENGKIQIKGQNRTALSVILFCFVAIPACAICGSKAEMQSGYEIQANVATNTKIAVE